MTPSRSRALTSGEHPGTPKAPALMLVTFTEAAELCGVHRDVIKRRHRAGQFPNAERGEDKAGTWRVPVTDLGAAGLSPGRPTPGDEPPAVPAPAPGELAAVTAERDRLRVELAEWKARAEERESALELVRMTFRALPAAEAPTAPVQRRGGLLAWLAGRDA